MKTVKPAQPRNVVVALAGDAMLGRAVASEFKGLRRPALLSAELEDTIRAADMFILNLECCISRRGERWPAPGKPFFFRAPPETADFLADVGVDCVTLANNHALDFGTEALLDTIEHLSAVNIRVAGAGRDLARAREPAVIEYGGFRLAVVGVTDHPAAFSADADRAGVAFADFRNGDIPAWLLDTLAAAQARADAVLLSPHWGPNLTARPPDHVRRAARSLKEHATLIAGHSAHVFHGVQGNVLFDLGDFVNDYSSVRPSRNLLIGILDKLRKEASSLSREAAAAARARAGGDDSTPEATFLQQQRWRAARIARMIRARTMRPDLGLLFLVTVGTHGPMQFEGIPLKIGRCHTQIATGREAAFVHARFQKACAEFDTPVRIESNRATIAFS